MKFLVDAQLPPALALWLREAGHDSGHVEDFDLREANDAEILEHALRNGSVIITKDEDFVSTISQKQIGPFVVWLRIGNSTNRELRLWIEPRLPGIVQLIAQGSRLVEVV